MSRSEYLAGGAAVGPVPRQVARAHLDLAERLAPSREALGFAPQEVATRTGVPVARLAEIEEGDTTSLTEVLRLCAGLALAIELVPLDAAASPVVVAQPSVEASARGAA